MDKSKADERTKNIINNFSQQLQLHLRDNLKAVILYGSVAAGDYSKSLSDINILVVLEANDIQNLSVIAKIKNNLKFRRISPIVFTKTQLENTTDTFPVEFLDMQENHIALWGEDCLKDLKIDLKNLRHQCEWELKSKIIQMQRFYMDNKIKNTLLSGFLVKNLPSFIVIFKNLLRLKNISENKKDKILERIALEFSLDKDVFSKLYQARQLSYKLSNGKELFGKFLSELQQLSDKVDGLSIY